MGFAVGTIIAIVALIVAILTYLSTQRQSFKRIHCDTFMTPLIMSWNEETLERLTVRMEGEELINPYLCAVSIENTGRSPIVPQDFDAPLKIRNRSSAILRCATIDWNRPEMIERDRLPEIMTAGLYRHEISGHEIRISPILLNPNDRITISYIADVAPVTWGLEVLGHIAGVEEIIELPKPDKSPSLTAHIESLATTDESSTTLDQPRLNILVPMVPLLANPDDTFDELEISLDGTAYQYLNSLNFAITNDSMMPLGGDSQHILTFEFRQSEVVEIGQVHQKDRNGTERPANSKVCIQDNSIVVNMQEIDPKETLYLHGFVTGKRPEVRLKSQGVVADRCDLLRFDVDSIIEHNLAQAGSRLLLSNQRLYLLWRALNKQFVHLRGIMRAMTD